MKKAFLVLTVTMSIMVGAAAAAPGSTKATGTIRNIDLAAGKITLAREPVPTLEWPAMTMPFRIRPEQASGLKVGQKVDFEFVAKGMDGTKIRIGPAN